MKKGLKNIVAFIILLATIILITPISLYIVIRKYFIEFGNYFHGREVRFPKIFSKLAFDETKKLIAEYFTMKLWEQSLACVMIIIGLYAVNKWKFLKSKNNESITAKA